MPLQLKGVWYPSRASGPAVERGGGKKALLNLGGHSVCRRVWVGGVIKKGGPESPLVSIRVPEIVSVTSQNSKAEHKSSSVNVCCGFLFFKLV